MIGLSSNSFLCRILQRLTSCWKFRGTWMKPRLFW